MTQINALKQAEPEHYADDVRFTKDENGLDYIEIENRHATAKLALQGGHIMHWQPRHTAEPVLWLSKESRYETGRSIRGGIPLAHIPQTAACVCMVLHA